MTPKYSIDEVTVKYDANHKIKGLEFIVKNDGSETSPSTWKRVKVSTRDHEEIAALFDNSIDNIYSLIRYTVENPRRDERGSSFTITNPDDLDDTTITVPSWIENLVMTAIVDMRDAIMVGEDINRIEFMVDDYKDLTIKLKSNQERTKVYKCTMYDGIHLRFNPKSDLSIEAALVQAHQKMNEAVNQPYLSAVMESKLKKILDIYKQVLK